MTEALGSMGLFIPMLIAIVALFIFTSRSNRKKDQKTKQMLDEIQIGDEIVTKGGIIGIIVSIKDDTFVIETAGERNKIRVKRWAIYTNDTMHD